MTELSRITWRKSSRSGGGNNCVEVAEMKHSVSVRDSKNPDGGALTIDGATWQTMIGQIKHGDHDL